MKDQVDDPQACDSAEALNSSCSYVATRRISELEENVVQILYVSPEKAVSDDFLALIASSITLIAVDEAHRISMGAPVPPRAPVAPGPERAVLQAPMVAPTATATPDVHDTRGASINNPTIYVGSSTGRTQVSRRPERRERIRTPP